jgi:hypothetical protein
MVAYRLFEELQKMHGEHVGDDDRR